MVQLSNLTLMTTENPSDHPSQHLKDVLALLEQDQKIEAIRLYQERFGVTLVEARQAVEAIEEGLRREQPLVNVPEVPLRQAARATAVLTAGTGCFTFGLIGFILLVTLVPIFFAMMASGGPLEEWGIRVNPFASQRVELAFGEEGIGEGMFQDPRSIAVASNGDIYIAGYQDGRIQRFDSEGRFLDLWNVGKKEIIYSLEVDRNGIVYAAYGREFNRFEGDSGRQLEPLSNPLDQVAHTIRSMADGGLIAVYGNDSLVRFNATGGVDWVLENSVSTVADETEMTVRVASDGLGNIYALGTSLQAVFKVSPEGKFITRWGSRGEADEQFRAAHAIAVDRQGRVYVSDFNGVKVFENDGRYVSFIRVKGFPFGLDFDGQGRLHVVGNAHRVYRYSVPKP
jgi:streptogramin lyase